jgi:ketosteroid isomerase-like protein
MNKIKIYSITWIFAILCFNTMFGQTSVLSDTSGNYTEVKHTIEQSIGWAIEKDFEAMYKLWADDMFHFWLTSGSMIIGLDDFKKYSEVWKDPGFRGTRYEFKDLRIVFSQSGDLAWYSCFLDDCGSFNGEESCLKDVFQTGVLEKRDGRWVHVLVHGSYPIDKIPENYVRQFYSNLFENSNEIK